MHHCSHILESVFLILIHLLEKTTESLKKKKESSLTSYIQLPHEQVWHARYLRRETSQCLVSHMLF